MCRFCLFSLLLIGLPVAAIAADYDPLQLPDQAKLETIDLTVQDADRKRDLPIRIYLPGKPSPVARRLPVVLFSHGLGGNREGSAYLGRHWAARGYVCVFLQHPGSDDQVWKSQPVLKRMRAMQRAASLENYLLRIQDVPAVLDQLEAWNASEDHELARRLDLEHVGMSGHSFGAQTTQAVSGQSAGKLERRFTDARIKAAVSMSPGTPRLGDPKAAFADVRIPWLLMTGTKDTSPIGGQTVESRQAVFAALPPGSKYELVLWDAEHSAFTDRKLPGDREPRNPNHHRVILALSTAFWDAYLQENATAKAWLDGDGPKSVLQPQDRWQTK
jgi:predicted dienelactone hydrolase